MAKKKLTTLGKELDKLDEPMSFKFDAFGKHLNKVTHPISRKKDGSFGEVRYSGKPGPGSAGGKRKKTTK